MVGDGAPASLGWSVQEKAERLRTFGFFRDSPEYFFRELAMITEIRDVLPGVCILNEGQINESLFFLISGAVEIYVLGERVAQLNKAGDILGEMSLITARPASATITAVTPVSFFAIPSTKLEGLVRSSLDFGYYLYRTFSLSLSEKIVFTNDKARRFEMANRALTTAIQDLEKLNNVLEEKVSERTKDLTQKTKELERSYLTLETQNAELFASHRRIEELYSSKDVTFRKLTDLHTDHLEPLQDLLSRVDQAAIAPEDRQKMLEVKTTLASSIDMLKPMTSLYSTEQQMRSKRVLLLESERKQQVIAKLALGGTGVDLAIVSSTDECINFLQVGERVDLAFISPDLVTVAPQIKSRWPKAKLVFMASTDIPAFLPVLRQHPIFSNIVTRDVNDRTFTVKSIMTTVSKLLSHDLFGLEKYLIWGVEVHSHTIERSDQRMGLIDLMTTQFRDLGVRSRVIDRAVIVVEELLMNAIYDAPHGPDGKSLYNHLPRTELVELAKIHQGEMRFACDGMLAAVSVSDPFGGFETDVLLRYLERNYAGVDNVQMAGKGGAGRGLHQIIENSDLVVFNVRPGKKTEVIALFDLDVQAAEGETSPSFHFFLD